MGAKGQFRKPQGFLVNHFSLSQVYYPISIFVLNLNDFLGNIDKIIQSFQLSHDFVLVGREEDAGRNLKRDWL